MNEKAKMLKIVAEFIVAGEALARALSMTADYIAKWRNIPFSDYQKMDGFVLCDDNRNGKIAFIVLF